MKLYQAGSEVSDVPMPGGSDTRKDSTSASTSGPVPVGCGGRTGQMENSKGFCPDMLTFQGVDALRFRLHSELDIQLGLFFVTDLIQIPYKAVKREMSCRTGRFDVSRSRPYLCTTAYWTAKATSSVPARPVSASETTRKSA